MKPSAERSPRLFRFGDLSAPVSFTDCDDLIPGILSIFRGWAIEELAGRDDAAPIMRIKKTPCGYRRVSRWQCTPSRSRRKIRKTIVQAICGFHFEFIDWFLEENPDQLFVHGAAARFGDRLVVFPAVTRVGKSVLTVHLAMSGHEVFCDDVLPIDTESGWGLALGIVPRLRPPLPLDVSDAFRTFVERHEGQGHRNRLYVDLADGQLAPFGASAPIGAIVLLERGKNLEPFLMPADRAEALEDIILQNFAREVPAPKILDKLHAVVSEADCYRLTYTRADEAVALLQEAFGGGDGAT